MSTVHLSRMLWLTVAFLTIQGILCEESYASGQDLWPQEVVSWLRDRTLMSRSTSAESS